MTQETLIRSIPMEMWCELAKERSAPPVTISLEGDSMRPLIRRGKDPVTIIALDRPLAKGDVVLFRLGERYIVHRVWKLEDGRVRTFGDNCWNPDPWIPMTQVLGLVVKYSRNGKVHRLDTQQARTWGRCWMALHPLRIMYLRCRNLAARIVKRILKVVKNA